MPDFQVSALSVVNQIKSNLQDRYHAGYPILKELLQNADDAKACRFVINALSGWPNASNPILRGPGFLIVNDGFFYEKDERDIISFGESGKVTDSATIGKFGIGQKAVFHLCDAFVVYFRGDDRCFNTVVNPFLNVQVEGNVTKNWEILSDGDLKLLRDEVSADFSDHCLILWLPVRRKGLQPAPGTGFSVDFPNVSTVVEGLARPDDLRMLLTALRHLKSVEILDHGRTCCLVGIHDDAERLLGPKGGLDMNRSFHGTFETHPDDSTSSFVGREVMVRSGRLKSLQCSLYWPKTTTVMDPEPQPEKGEPHGAVTLSHGVMNGPSHLRMSWAAFLPISEDSEVLIPIDRPDIGQFDLLLHGYFFLDSGRLRIEGLSERVDDHEPSGTTELRRAWNAELRDSVVLPLIPAVLHDSLNSKMATSAQIVDVVTALAKSSWFRDHRDAVCKKNMLLRVLEGSSKINWRLLPSETVLRPLPKMVTDAPQRIEELFAQIHSWTRDRNTFLCVDKSSALMKEPMLWTTDELRSLFSSLSPLAFQSRALAPLLAEFLDSVEPNDTCREVIGPHLVSVLRKTLQGGDSLAPLKFVSRILAHIPSKLLFSLPSSVEHRHVLQILASSPANILPVRSTWVGDTFSNPVLSDNDLSAFLNALEHHLDGERGDEAATAALAFLTNTGRKISEFSVRPEYAVIKILRVRDLRAGEIVSLSIGDLLERARKNSVFRPSPDANTLLPLSVKALPSASPVIIEGRTGKFFFEANDPEVTLQVAGRASIFRLINSTPDFGPTNARARLLQQLQPLDSDDRKALRRLCTGAKEAGDAHTDIWAMGAIPERLERPITDLLRKSGHDFLVPHEIVAELTPRLRKHLGMKTLDTEKLETLLEEHLGTIELLTLTDAEREAFLLANLSDLLLRCLPIHVRSDATIGDLKDVFREDNWKIPQSLIEHVLTVQPCVDPNARKKQQDLIRAWSPESQIETALSLPEPHGLQNVILDALAQLSTVKSNLTQELSDQLRKRLWLVVRGIPVAPQDVLSLPEAVDQKARELLTSEGGGPPFWPARALSIDVQKHPGFEYLVNKILPDEHSSFEALALMIEESGIVGRLGSAGDYPMKEFTALANANADLKLPGWPLLAAALLALKDDSDRAARIVEAFSELSDVNTDQTAGHLDSLAGIAEEKGIGSASARKAYLRGFEVVAKWPQASRRRVFGGTRVPTMAGGWRSGQEVIESGDGIASMHVLAPDCASLTGTYEAPSVNVFDSTNGTGNPVEHAVHQNKIVDIDLAKVETQFADQQRKFLQTWRSRLPSDLVIVWLGLVGRGAALKQLASEWAADATTDVDTLWFDLDNALKPTLHANPLPEEVDQRRYLIKIIKNHHVRALALSGEPFEAPLGDDDAGLLVGNLHKNSQGIKGSDGKIRSLFTLQVRNFDPVSHDHDDASAVFRRFVETVATDCLWLDQSNQRQVLQEILDKAVNVDQATLANTEYLLRERLPTILAELKLPADCHAQQALRAYQQEEGFIARLPDAAQKMEELKKELWEEISNPEALSELLTAVRAKVGVFGYSANRVIYELFQNADDAYQQLAPVPNNACFRLVVVLEDFGGFRAIHWGRKLNHLGSDPDEGHRLGRDRDLLNMLLFNFSEKRTEEDLTGKFGLGFKSVHILSDSIGIASGFIALRTFGGMMPKVWPEGIDEAEKLRRDDGSQATVIDVPFSVETAADGEAAVRAFRASAVWMSAFARSIRHIEIDDGDPLVVDCQDAPLLDELAIRIVIVSDNERRRALRFDIANDYRLLIAIGVSGPEAFPDNLNRLWNLAPLEEDLRSGWLLNGPFPVDPGRGRLAGSIEDQRENFRELGRSLGNQLLKLHDLAEKNWERFASDLDLNASEPKAQYFFWSGLFDLFGLDSSDRLADQLHVDGGGYKHLVANRHVVPTGLLQPLDDLVRASEVEHFTDKALSETIVQEKVREWPSFGCLQGKTVSSEIAGQLRRLGFDGIHAITVTDLLRREMGKDNRLDVELTKRLGMVITPSAIEKAPLGNERRGILATASNAKFRARDGTWRSVRNLNSEATGSEDEALLCGFAPEEALLDRNYQGAALEFFKVARSESGYGPQAQLLHAWAMNAYDEHSHRAILQYIVSGRQGRALAKAVLVDPPTWLPQPLERLLSEQLFDDWSDRDKKRLLIELGADHLFDIDKLAQRNGGSDADPAVVFNAIHDWWSGVGDTKRVTYKNAIYPEGFSPSRLRRVNDRAEWFTMFALACFQSLGRTQDDQHRKFIERGQQEGWWQEMAVSVPPDNVQPWLDRLESWSEPAQIDQKFFLWRRTLVDLYTISRGLDVYVEIIQRLPHLVRDWEKFSLDFILQPSYAPILMPLGLDAAPINRSLGIGVNWMLRELLRYGVYEPEDTALIVPYCWAPTRRVRKLLDDFGASVGVQANKDDSPEIYDFIIHHIGADRASFFGDFDLPLQLITRSENGLALNRCFAEAGRDPPDFGDTEEHDLRD